MICATANPSLDAVFAVDRLVPGEIHRSSELVRVAGGKGLNVARAARTLGAEPLAVALLGGPGGRWIADRLAELGIGLVAVPAPGDTRSCLSVYAAESASLTEFYEAGDPIDAATWDAFAAAVRAACTAGGRLVLTGSLPPGAPEDGYAQLCRAAAAAGASCAVDASGAPLAHALAAGPDLVKVNAAEAAGRLGDRDAIPDDPAGARRSALRAAAALRELAGAGGRVAVVTCGAHGAALAGPGLRIAGHVAADGRYPVGSGDAFLAGLVAARERGRAWDAAFAAGLAAGAANAEIAGPGLLDPGRAERLFARVEIETLVRD